MLCLAGSVLNMGELSGEIFNSSIDGGIGLRCRGIHCVSRQPSLIANTYRDESCLSASIEYISDGNGNETIPVFVTRAGNTVFIPPSIADLLRDKPPDHVSGGSDYDDEEADRRHLRKDTCDFDPDTDSNDSSTDDIVKIKIKSDSSLIDEDCDNEAELKGVQIIPTMRKLSDADDDWIFDSDLLSSFWEQFKHVGPKLMPFFKTLGLYCVFFIPEDRPSLFAMMIKCLPVASLVLFIVLHGIGLSDEYKFSRRILTGLVFSCMGDAFLIWPNYFLHGMAAFAMAHCFYIRAFGLQPLNWQIAIITYTITSSSLIFLLPGLLKDATSILVGVLVYSGVLTTMLWRALARVELSLESLSWSKFSACVGGISFAISDAVLALNQFYAPIPYHQTIIMATYYTGQLGIALSVVTPKEHVPLMESFDETDDVKLGNGAMGDYSEFLRNRKNKAAI